MAIAKKKSLITLTRTNDFTLLGIGLVGLAGAEVRRRRIKKAVDKT
jgi:MYXO-CTERM domain-containing protein